MVLLRFEWHNPVSWKRKLPPPPRGTGSVYGPSALMEGVRGQHEHHNKQNNDKEENKGWFAILLLQLLQPGELHYYSKIFGVGTQGIKFIVYCFFYSENLPGNSQDSEKTFE